MDNLAVVVVDEIVQTKEYVHLSRHWQQALQNSMDLLNDTTVACY